MTATYQWPHRSPLIFYGARMRQAEQVPPLGRSFQRLWFATAVSNLGNGVLFASVPLLAQTITTSPTSISLVTVATLLPGLLVALHAGAMVDRLDRRRVMVTMDLSRLAVLVGFSLLVVGDHVPMAVLYVTAFLLGAGDVTFDGAARSVVPALVPTERLHAANGRLAAATDVMDELLGPPTGVALFALAAWVPFVFDAGTFAISAIFLASLAGTFRAERAGRRPTLRREIGEGLRFVRESRLLRVLAGGTGMLAFFSSANLAVLVLFALETLDLPKAGYGYLLMTIAIGGVLGSLAVEWMVKRWRETTVLTAAVAGNGAAYVLLALSHGPLEASIATVVWGFSVSTGMTISIGMRQTRTPDALLGRVMSVFRVLVGIGGVLGALAGGVLANAFGLRAPYLCSGITQLVLAPVFGFAIASAARVRART
jgi:MFS family permease